MDIQTGNPDFVWLCVFGLVVVALAVWSHLAYQRAAARFAMAPMRKRLVPGRSTAAGLLSAALVTISVVLLGVALMDLRWGKTSRKVPQKGIEVMFALDVSRSMLAEDTTPNRLERAKQQINDMVDEMAGDRVGLVVFAGSAKRVVPLTSHYQDFKKTLDSVGPHTVARGGSRLGVAIQKAADGFITKTNDHKTIILFTDGEDQESHPVELARELHAEEGMRIFTVGLGDTDQGARIPDAGRGSDQFLKHEGQQVWSKLNGQVLRTLATETDGAYIPAGTKQVNMADVYHRYVASVQQTEFETAKINTTVPRFQWFAGAALLLLLLEGSLANGPWRTGLVGLVQRSWSPKSKKANVADAAGSTAPVGSYRQAAAGTVAILFCLMFTAGAAAQETLSVAEQINAANQDLRDKNVAQALESLQGIDDPAGQYQAALNYNLAVAHYRNEDIAAAEPLFLNSAQSADTSIAAASRYNLGNCHYSQALALTQQDPQAAIDQLQAAITHYRSSLRLNADNADARANIELARQLIDQLQKEQEQQEQQQNQDQQNQDQEDKDQENQDGENQDQENQDQQSQDGENQDQQSQDQESQDQENQDQENQDQENQDQENQDQENQDQENQDQENQDQENQGQENQDQENQDQENQDGQSQDGENQDQKNQDQKNQDQKNQDGENQDQQQQQNQDQQNQDGQSQAQQQQQQDQQPQNQQQSQQQGQEQQAQDPESAAAEDQQADSPETPSGELTSVNDEPNATSPDEEQRAAVTGQMTREEALKMLQSVRDRDMLRRLQQQQRQRSRRVRVDKDW